VPASETPPPPVPPPPPWSTGGSPLDPQPVRRRRVVPLLAAAVALAVAALALVVAWPDVDTGVTADSGTPADTGLAAAPPPDALPSGEPITEQTLIGKAPDVSPLVIADLDGTPVFVVEQTFEIRVLDMATGELIGKPITGLIGGAIDAAAVTATRLDDRSVVVTGGHDNVIRLYDLATGAPLATTLTGHTGAIVALGIAEVDGRKVLVSAASDNTIRFWDLVAAAPIGEPVATPADVEAMSVIRSAGRAVVLVRGSDTIQAWDVAHRTPVGVPLRSDQLGSIVTVEVAGTTAVLVRDFIEDRLVDLYTGAPLPGFAIGTTATRSTAAVVAGRPLFIDTDDELIQVRDFRDGGLVGSRIAGHEDLIFSLDTVNVGDRTYLISTSADNSIRIWDLTARSQG
jgi:WD40 repeat protein